MKMDVTRKEHAMTDDTHDLARRAVATDSWRWVEGMAAVHPPDGETHTPSSHQIMMLNHSATSIENLEVLPDIEHPATKGCLLELVREAWGLPGAYVQHLKDGLWRVESGREDSAFITRLFHTEAAALVAALEAADE